MLDQYSIAGTNINTFLEDPIHQNSEVSRRVAVNIVQQKFMKPVWQNVNGTNISFYDMNFNVDQSQRCSLVPYFFCFV